MATNKFYFELRLGNSLGENGNNMCFEFLPQRWALPSGAMFGRPLPSYGINAFDIGHEHAAALTGEEEEMEDAEAEESGDEEAAHYRRYAAILFIYHSLVFDFLCEIHWSHFHRINDSQEWQTLTRNLRCSTSKLSQDELVQLQKETHFDKKELQQWYKGMFATYYLLYPA